MKEFQGKSEVTFEESLLLPWRIGNKNYVDETPWWRGSPCITYRKLERLRNWRFSHWKFVENNPKIIQNWILMNFPNFRTIYEGFFARNSSAKYSENHSEFLSDGFSPFFWNFWSFFHYKNSPEIILKSTRIHFHFNNNFFTWIEAGLLTLN